MVSLEPGLEFSLVLGHLLDQILDLKLSSDYIGLIIGEGWVLDALHNVGRIGLLLCGDWIVQLDQ